MYSTVYIHGVDIEVLLLIGNTVPCWLVCCFQQAMSHFWKGCVKSNEESDLQCFITVINKGLNDVKCSKASNTLCTIHDPWVVILLLLFQLTFPPAFMFPLLDKLLLPQRWSRKTSLFGSSQETEWMLKTTTRPRRLLMFKALCLSHISHPQFISFKIKISAVED